MIEALRDVFGHWEFLKQLTLLQLRARYRGSILGFLWALLVPLFFFGSMTIVFSFINGVPMHIFGIYLFSGYVAWQFFATTATQASGCILQNAHLITRIRTPNAVYPFVTVLVNLVEFAASMVVLLAFMLYWNSPITPALLVLPLSCFLLIVFVTGVSFAFAATNVFFRDFSFIWTTVSFVWFFFTPILYPYERIPVSFRPYFEMNPFLPYVRLFQEPINSGVFPSAQTIGIAAIYALVMFVFGTFFFVRSQRSFYLYV